MLVFSSKEAPIQLCLAHARSMCKFGHLRTGPRHRATRSQHRERHVGTGLDNVATKSNTSFGFPSIVSCSRSGIQTLNLPHNALISFEVRDLTELISCTVSLLRLLISVLRVEKVSAERSDISEVVNELRSLISRDNSLDV